MNGLPLAAPQPVRLERPRLTVDLEAVAANVRTLRATTGTPLLAVVKADGYGCGAERVARAALSAGATWLGTATLDEAVALRRAGLAAPTLSWVHPVDSDWEAAVRLRIDVAISSVEHLLAVAAAARRTPGRARVHLHVDTGMARDGAPAREWRRLVRAAADRPDEVEVVGVMGHLPCADQEHPSNAEGVRTMSGAVAVVRAAGLRPVVRHLAATAAAQRLPAARLDLVRIGAGLHGFGADGIGAGALRPAATLTAPVVLTRRVPSGAPVGYGHAGVAERATVLATLPLGYADGLPRRIDADAGVQLGGRRCRVVGRVSMDQVVVDAGPTGVPVGAVATVFGDPASGEPTLSDWARWADTVEQDVLAGVGARVQRVQR